MPAPADPPPPVVSADQNAPSDASTSGGIQDIVVTAQRKSENLMSVPLAITATSGGQLQANGIREVAALQFNTPGFLPNNGVGYTQLYIRGIGNNIYVGADPSVVTNIDDVPRIYGSMVNTFVNVERVEVLKGAQGGLYGRNATGGVLNIITRQPSTDRLTANFLGSYGEKNTVRAAGYVNVPISDRIAFSFSGERDSHASYVRNVATKNPYTASIFPQGAVLPIPNGTAPLAIPGVATPLYAYSPQQTADFFNAGVHPGALNDQDFYALDAKLLLKPTEDLKITIAGDYDHRDDTNGSGFVSATPAIFQSSLTALFSALGVTVNLPPNFITDVDRKFTASNGIVNRTATKDWGVSGTAVLSLPGVDLTSISAYRRQDTIYISDAGSTTVPFAPLDVRFDPKRFYYQELRGVSTFDGPLHLLGGATYLDNRQAGRSLVGFLSPAIQVGDTEVDDRVKNWSVYAQAGYDITDRLNLTASGRYQHESNSALFTEPLVSRAHLDEHKFVPSATLSYRLDGGGTAYARWARGFKTGGINTANAVAYYPNPSTDGSIFGPETVDTYEIGYRNALFDKRVQVTAAAFYNDYRNLQVYAHPFFGAKDALGNEASSTITTAVVNAKSARTYGVEGSVNWRVLDTLTLGANAGYLNAKYRNFQLSGSTVLAPIDRDGERLQNAPKFQASFNANLDQPITDRLNLTSTVLVSHTSSVLFVYSSSDFVPDNQVPGFWLVNARIGVHTRDDRLGLALVADNLFNKVYYVQGSSVSFGNNLQYGNPRIIRGEVTVKF